MFKIELTNVNNSTNTSLCQMENNNLKLDYDKNFKQDFKSRDINLTNETSIDDDYNQRAGSADFTTSNSSSDDSNESSEEEDSRSEDEENGLTHHFRQISNIRGTSINRSFKHNNKEDLFLNSLEADRFASTKLYVRNRNKNDIDHIEAKNKSPKSTILDKPINEVLNCQNSQSFVNKSNQFNVLDKNFSSNTISSRTIKAATRYIDAQGKKAANLTKQQSQSMVNLSSDLSTEIILNENALSCNSNDQSNVNNNDTHLKDAKTLQEKINNHATSAIRSIIESQYAVLQQENSTPKHGLELKKRKKQNKFKSNSHSYQNSEESSFYYSVSPRSNNYLQDNGKNTVNFSTNNIKKILDLDKHLENDLIPKKDEQLELSDEIKTQDEKLMSNYLNIPKTSDSLHQTLNSESNNKEWESNLERKSQQFNCLPSRPSYQNDEDKLNSTEITISNPLRSLSIQAPDCPLERFQFYKSFTQLIRKGRKGLEPSAKFMNNNRLLKYGGIFELIYKQELRDLIWLEIKAWMDNRSMIEQDTHLCLQRKNIPKTLEKLMKFSVNLQFLNDNTYQEKIKDKSAEQIFVKTEDDNIRKNLIESSSKLNESKLNRSSNENVTVNSEVNDLKSFIDQDTLAASVAIKLTMNESNNTFENTKYDKENSALNIDSPNPDDDNCNCSETLSKLCQYCVDKESAALEQVNKILAEVDEIEQLYPCVKSLAIDYPLYEREQFVARIKSLYLYQNIIRDLRKKINLLAKLFHIHNREAAGWPNFHDQTFNSSDYSYNTSSDCTPEIFNITNLKEYKQNKTIKQESYSGYSYKLNAPSLLNNGYQKQVHFKDDVNSMKSNSNSDLAASCLDSPDANLHSTLETTNDLNDKSDNPFFPRKISIYRRYVDKALKHKGLRYIYHQLSHILRPLLYRVHAALKKPALLSYEPNNIIAQAKQTNTETNENCDLCHNTKKIDGKICDCTTKTTLTDSNRNFGKQNSSTNKNENANLSIPEEYYDELSQYGVWSLSYQQMGLPTFHRPFLFLLRVTVDVVHECLILRLEQQPEQPSNVSVGQLIRECKEVIKAGVQIKRHYINLAQIVLGEAGTELFEAQLDSFNDDLKTMLIIYLKYLESYMVCMQSVTSKSNSTLKQKGYLEQEWNFVRLYCPHIPGGEALTANKFCVLASDLLISIGDYIENGVNDAFKEFKDSLNFVEQDESLFRKGILSSCRSFKLVFQEANAKVCQATAFAKSLRKDLEIAAEYQILIGINDLLEKLKNTGHIRVIAPNCCNHLLFIPGSMQNDISLVWQLLDMTCGGRSTHEVEHFDSTPGYLLIASFPNDCQWTGTHIYLEQTTETILTLSHVEANGIFFVVNNPSQLTNRCRQFSNLMIGSLKILKHQTSCNNAIANALTELKNEALKIQEKTANSLDLIYKKLELSNVSSIDVSDKNILQMRCLDVLHQGFKFTFEYEKALTRLITGDSRVKLAKQLINFSFQWITFVVNKCEKGRGLRARWVYPGLQYLIVALEPQYIQVLDQQEFKLLKDEVDKFLTHIIGSTEQSPKTLLPHLNSTINLQGPYSVLDVDIINKPLASSLNFQRSQSVVNVKGMFSEFNFLDKHHEPNSSKGTRLEDWLSKKIENNGNILQRKRSNKFVNKLEVIASHNNELNSNSDSKTGQNDDINGHIYNLTRNDSSSYLSNELSKKYSKSCFDELSTNKMGKVKNALKILDEKRDQRLKEKGIIGSVSDLVIQRAPFQVAARKVNFPWQRGFKIGEGRFGKVYTAVNNSTGELIAMKEIHLQHANDNRAIKETIDEIMIFEGIKHANLVKYFGVEIHRNELYIFMEYCNEGSLESAVQLKLPEQLVRRYTRQLLEAVNCLHENGIVHRDIKSANIFLTLNGNLKLGDFGCCMKLKNHSTMPGELCTLVGTPAYMAPEMFTRNSIEGHGRSSDIWSIGCVVLEMLTGRRPWHDLENAYQIMFKVGMGEIPEVPNDICCEGKFFINKCLKQDPRSRWSTGQLLGHSFTKVAEDDDLL